MEHPTSTDGFAHERLDAYWIAQEMATACVHVTDALPRGFADMRNQARRSALATVRHIAEGASRTSPADKSARFTVARGEVAELDATLASAQMLDLAPQTELRAARLLTRRVGAMLTGLIKRESRLLNDPR